MTISFFAHTVLPMLVFAGFIVLALRARQGDSLRSSARLRMLFFYVIAVSMYVGLSGRDLWPFAAWRYVSYSVEESGTFPLLLGVDKSGREYRLDTRAFEPLEYAAVMGDLDWYIERMEPAHRTELLNFYLGRAQKGLARARAGLPVGSFRRFLGPFAAPVFQWAITPWKDHDNLPPELTELRFYRAYWRASGAAVHIERQVLVADTRS